MGFFSKLWKGIKGAVKKVAKTIKKVAKKVAHAIPGGKQLWKLGTKIGKGIMKGVGKVMKALGPIGMIGLSFVIGPAAGALWSGFSAMAPGIASFLSTATAGVTSALGTASSFISGTLGSIGEAILGGAQKIIAGEGFTAGAQHFATNMANALTGKAGMAAVDVAAAAATGGLTGLEAGMPSGTELFGAPGAPATAALDPIGLQMGGSGVQLPGVAGGIVPDSAIALAPEATAALAQQNIATEIMADPKNPKWSVPDAKSMLKGTVLEGPAASNSLLSGKGIANLLRGGDEEGGYGKLPIVAPLKSAVAGSSVGKGGGVGSSGFSLLDPVRGLKESIQASQQMMFS